MRRIWNAIFRWEKSTVAAGGLILLGTGFLIWKCGYCVDLLDEPTYLAPAWKLFRLGDRPFFTDIYIGPRHHDLINYVTVRWLIPYSVYASRVTCALLYSFILFILTRTSFRGHFGVTAGLVFCAAILFDPVFNPSWSYNWWPRLMFPLHHFLLLTSAATTNLPRRKVWNGAAGFALGIAIVAYNTLVVGWILVVAGALLYGKLRSRSDSGRYFRWYLLGALIPLAIDIFYLLLPSVRPGWIASLSELANLKDYASVTPLGRVRNLLTWIIQLPELWCLLAIAGLQALAKRFPKHGRLPFSLSMVLLVGVWIATRSRAISSGAELFRAFVGLGLGSGVLLFIEGYRQKKEIYSAIALLTMVAMASMGVSSAGGEGATFWLVPSILIPFFGWVALPHWLEGKKDALNAFSYALSVCLLMGLVARISSHNLKPTYMDVGIPYATTEIKVPPFRFIRTSARRAYLVESLSEVLRDKKFAIAFPYLSGAFLFHNVQSSLNTIIVQPHVSLANRTRSLNWMVDQQRYPEVIIRVKAPLWAWGKQESNDFVLPKTDPLNRFTDCVAKRILLSEPEFEVFEVDSHKVKTCQAKALEK